MAKSVFKTIVWKGVHYSCLKLAGPETLIGIPDPDWNYSEAPIGPGTMGYGKTIEVINSLKDRYHLFDLTMVDDKGNFNIDNPTGLLLRGNTLYTTKITETSGIEEGDKIDDNAIELREIIERAFQVV